VVLAVGFGGCNSGGVKRVESTTTDMAETTAYIQSIKTEIDAAMQGLNDIQTAAESDATPAYTNFAVAVDKLEARKDLGRARVAAMRDRAERHFAAWERELAVMTNVELRARSAGRLAAARESVQKITVIADDAKREFDPMLAEFKDLKIYLGNDLNPTGIGSVRDQVSKLSGDAELVKQALNAVTAEIETTRVAMSPRQAPKQQVTVVPDAAPVSEQTQVPTAEADMNK